LNRQNNKATANGGAPDQEKVPYVALTLPHLAAKKVPSREKVPFGNG
jgi:hypothetical protein